MPGKTIRIRASEGGEFDCYVAVPDAPGKTPSIVLACAIAGLDQDMRDTADDFAARGYVAAAPDLFWRTVPGPLPAEDPRRSPRGQPRAEKIKTGEADMADTLAYVRTLPQCNGRAAVIGFCYGGPYAIIGPKRLGYEAGLSCHGTRMQDYLPELEGLNAPVCVMWGEQDHAAPAEVLDAYRGAAARHKNLELHIFPGILHGYMLAAGEAYDAETRAFSMGRAFAILDGLRGETPGDTRAAE